MKIRTLVLAGAAAAASVVSAHADDAAWYVNLGAGWTSPQPAGDVVPAYSVTGRFGFTEGARGIASFGSAWPNGIRLEVEVGYADPDASRWIQASPTTGSGEMSGDLQQITLMGNLLYDVPIAQKWSLTVGGGLGIGFTSASITSTSGGGSKIPITGDQSAFAWQLIGGFVYKLDPAVDLQIDYRYLSISKCTYDFVQSNLSSSVTAGVFNSHSIMVSVRWYVNR